MQWIRCAIETKNKNKKRNWNWHGVAQNVHNDLIGKSYRNIPYFFSYTNTQNINAFVGLSWKEPVSLSLCLCVFFPFSFSSFYECRVSMTLQYNIFFHNTFYYLIWCDQWLKWFLHTGLSPSISFFRTLPAVLTICIPFIHLLFHFIILSCFMHTNILIAIFNEFVGEWN